MPRKRVLRTDAVRAGVQQEGDTMKVWNTTMTALAMAGALTCGAGTARAELISLFTFDDDATIQTNAVAGAYNGSLVNGPTNVAGVCGQALDFVAASTNYVDMDQDTTHVARPNTTDGKGGVYGGSLGFWVKTTQSTVGTIFSVMASSNNSYFDILLNNASSGQMRFYLRNNGDTGDPALLYNMTGSSPNWRDGAWHHVVFTWTNQVSGAGTGGGVCYIDATPMATSTGLNQHVDNTGITGWGTAVDVRMKIGAFRDPDHATGANRFDGAMDDLAFWNTRLASNEVAMLYEAGIELGYNAQDVEILKAVYAGGPGTSDQTGDGATWVYTTGLPPLSNFVDTVINDGGAMVMDADGNGVRKVGGALLSLLRFDGDADNAVDGAPDGTEMNSPAYVAGKIGQAIQFVGVNSNYVDMVNGARPNAVDGGIWSGSMSFWLKTTETAADAIWSVMAGNNSYWSLEPNLGGWTPCGSTCA
jgi:hypothetical protein